MQGRTLAVVCSLLAFYVPLRADELKLKTRTIIPEEGNRQSFLLIAEEPASRMRALRTHWLIQLAADGEQANLEELKQRGALILSHVPDRAYVLSVPDNMSWDELQFPYQQLIGRQDKLSPLLTEGFLVELATASGNASPGGARRLVLARFHKDVEAWEADGILDAEGITAEGKAVLQHASLQAEDRLLDLSAAQIAALQNWDEIEYLYPAPEGMRRGDAFLDCAGAQVSSTADLMLPISMLAQAYGEGWDGPGRGRAALTYSWGPATSRMPPDTVKAEILRAMAEWSRTVAVSFTESSQRAATRNVDILFAGGNHGDPYPFLPGSNVLGHTFYPAPPNPEPVAGDLHLNDAYNWSAGGSWDLYSVVLHELGHALGIGHTDDPDSVMYPYYSRASGLKPSDIASIRQIYADAGTQAPPGMLLRILSPAVDGQSFSGTSLNLSGSLSGAMTGVRVEAFNENNSARMNCLLNSPLTIWSCSAMPLAAGENRIVVSATQGLSQISERRSAVRQVEADAQILITTPLGARVSGSAESIDLSGTAQHASGISSVRWSTNRNQSGLAMGTASWTARVPLLLGETEITLTATARSGVSASRKLIAERTAAPATTPTGKDTTAPTMTIQQPISSFVITSVNRMTFRGTARDNVSVQRVTWTNSSGGQSGLADGTSQWSFDVNLNVGFNDIEVRVWDAAGNSARYTATVRRY